MSHACHCFLEMLQNPHVLLTFNTAHNPLRLPRETTSELPKVVRMWCVLYILTSKSASHHNSVHFFDTTTSKSGLNMVFFVFNMCFAPQWRALFRHLNYLNFQKWLECEVSLTFSLANVLRDNGVQFFISHLARWLRTRRFSEPTFRPSGATNHWKKHSVS